MTRIQDFDKFDNLCRICLKHEDPMFSIFTSDDEGSDDQSSLATRITSIAQVEMSPEDGLPTSVCQTCRQQVNKFYDFRLLVEVSDNTLRSYMEQTKKDEQMFVDDRARETDCQAYFIDGNANDDSKQLLIVNTVTAPPETEIWNESDVIESEETYLAPKHERRNESQKTASVLLIKNTRDDKAFVSSVQSDKLSKSPENTAWIADENDDRNVIAVSPNEYSCQLCTKPFKSLETLKQHVKTHCLDGRRRISMGDKNKRKATTVRSEKTENRERLSKAKETSRKIVNDRNENCNDDDDRAKGSKKLHRDGTEDSSVICPKCNKHFSTVQTYRTHDKRHTLGSRFPCTVCGKNYYTIAELRRHALLHTGIRKHSCHLCETSFFSKPELNRHIKYHNGEKRFRCEICSKTYYESGHLKVHRRVHTGERPYPCDVCEKAFITKSKLVRHSKVHEKKSSCLNDCR